MRAFKEWAIVCDALLDGMQTVLLRKGGIREEEGRFTITDTAFLLMPTYEHQQIGLVREEFQSRISNSAQPSNDPDVVVIRGWAEVQSIFAVKDEQLLAKIAHEHMWNEMYERLRLDFNPYDPLYIMVLRAFRLSDPVICPMIPEYVGCKSWVTLEKEIDVSNSRPAISDNEFECRMLTIRQSLTGCEIV